MKQAMTVFTMLVVLGVVGLAGEATISAHSLVRPAMIAGADKPAPKPAPRPAPRPCPKTWSACPAT
jgi:hypothetical protein